MTDTKQTILNLIDDGHELGALAEAEKSIVKQIRLAQQATGYFTAAFDLLGAFYELYDELIEHPKVIAARHFNRKWRV